MTRTRIANGFLSVLSAAALAACSKEGAHSAAEAATPATATHEASQPSTQPTAATGACGTILQSVKAGGNIVINVRCDEPTEAQILGAIAQQAWKPCPYPMPRVGWIVNDNPEAGLVQIVPGPGTYFGQYDFREEFQPGGMSQMDFVYIYRPDWEKVKETLHVPYDEYLKEIEIAKKYPLGRGGRVPGEGYFQASRVGVPPPEDQEDASAEPLKKVDTLRFRRNFTYGEGEEIVTLNEDVMRGGSRLSVGTQLLDRFRTYPNFFEEGGAGNIANLSCSASDEMSVATFKSLCQMLWEKQLLVHNMLSRDEPCENDSNDANRDSDPTSVADKTKAPDAQATIAAPVN